MASFKGIAASSWKRGLRGARRGESESRRSAEGILEVRLPAGDVGTGGLGRVVGKLWVMFLIKSLLALLKMRFREWLLFSLLGLLQQVLVIGRVGRVLQLDTFRWGLHLGVSLGVMVVCGGLHSFLTPAVKVKGHKPDRRGWMFPWIFWGKITTSTGSKLWLVSKPKRNNHIFMYIIYIYIWKNKYPSLEAKPTAVRLRSPSNGHLLGGSRFAFGSASPPAQAALLGALAQEVLLRSWTFWCCIIWKKNTRTHIYIYDYVQRIQNDFRYSLFVRRPLLTFPCRLPPSSSRSLGIFTPKHPQNHSTTSKKSWSGARERKRFVV